MSHASGQPPQAPAAVMPHAPTARRKPQPTHAARELQRCRPSAVAVIMLKSSSTAVSLRSARHPPPCTAAPHQPRPPLLKLRTVGTSFARASDPHRLRATSARIGLDCFAPFRLVPRLHYLGLFVFGVKRKRGSCIAWPASCRLRSHQGILPVKSLAPSKSPRPNF